MEITGQLNFLGGHCMSDCEKQQHKIRPCLPGLACLRPCSWSWYALWSVILGQIVGTGFINFTLVRENFGF